MPFKALTINTTKLVSPEYLPEGANIRDPRNMKKESIVAFFAHIKQRQDQYGADNSFRFQKVLGKHQETIEASYPTPPDQIYTSPRKQKGKQKARTALGLRQTGSAQGASAQNVSAQDAPHQPAQGTSAPGNHLTLIDQASMAKLLRQGHAPVPPVNGPNDGDPQYAVPVTALNLLEHPPIIGGDGIPVDPALLSVRPVAPKPRYRREPDLRLRTQSEK